MFWQKYRKSEWILQTSKVKLASSSQANAREKKKKKKDREKNVEFVVASEKKTQISI